MSPTKKYRLLLASGLLIQSGSTILHFMVPVHDFIYGGLQGLGITLIIASFLKLKKKPAC